ncbi:MAG: clostripain-related cysteine peptidase [Elusimicrobiota bacterium]
MATRYIAGAAVAAALLAAPAAAAGQRQPKDWTILVFVNGKNNLSPFVSRDINEMERFGPADNMNVVIQAARFPEPAAPAPYSPSNPYTPGGGFGGFRAGKDWSGARRYLLKGDGADPAISSELLEELGNVDMGDWRRLEEFGRWAKAAYPARRYMLIVWNHGSGWLLRDSEIPDDDGRAISSDDETGNSIEVPELAAALKGMGGADVYASDACLMQMAEVVYELRREAGVIVGSEANEPGDGWDYSAFLSRLHSNKDNLTPEVVAAAAVQGFRAAHEFADEPATLSAVRAGAAEELRALLDEWALQAMKEDREELSRAWDDTLKFGWAGSRDLADFLTLVHEGGASRELKALTDKVLRHYYSAMLLQSEAAGPGMVAARGLAVYMPGRYDPSYGRLLWSRDGKWDDFLRWIMGV